MLLLLTASTGRAQQASGLTINELMQSNVDCVIDELNDFPDSWVELYNGGSVGERLYKYQLGITPDPKEAYTLSAQMVQPGEYVLIYCDKVGSGPHAPFRLESGKGCKVYLFRDSLLVDSVVGLAKQPAPNISYGRKADLSSEWGYQLTPSPEEANIGGICDHDRLLGDPVFSETGRVLTGNHTLRIALSVPDGSPEGTEIRYTLDGSEPTVGSAKYLVPFTLSTTRVIRAKLFCEGWLSPRSVTQSYIFFPRRLTLPVISIATNNKYLNDSKLGILANNNSGQHVDWRRPINIEFFFGEDSVSAVNQLCETRVAGAASRGAAKKSMAIYAHKRFGTKRFSYEFFPDQCPGLTEYKSLVLRNAGNDFDYLYMRDALIQRTMASHADLDWQAWRPAIVYINGQYYGMLNIRERANDNNVYTHYDGLEDIDLLENWNSLKEGDKVALKKFKAFYEEHGHTMAEYEEWMDCQEFINLMAMNLYFNNYDFPGNNIIMWRARNGDASGGKGKDGRWRWIAKDCEYALGLYNDPVGYKILEWLYNPSYDGNKNWGANSYESTRLFRRLMEDRDFSREFIDHCAVYMGDFLNEHGVSKLWDAMYEQISFEYPYHRKLINQWWPNYNEELSNARNWLHQRTDIFYKQLADYYKLGTPTSMIITPPAGADATVGISVNGIRLSENVFDGKFFAGRQLTLEATSNDGQEVTGWRIQQINNGSSSTREVSGPSLSMTMPQCIRLVISPLVAAASDIHDAQFACSRSEKTWTWRRERGAIFLSGVPAGTRVSLYDLRGVCLHQDVSSGTDITLPLADGRPCVLRVGGDVVKCP